ncbi:MAG: hypothetical protein JSV04_14930 [Candidatus Heimdallarchaeota archaeon]|nr:MAG: hypothetical protein JSV04_14930 [Candidatus Heimdallarchaeota archaeon]
MIASIWFYALTIFPCFLYLYGFNQVNSFLRQSEDVFNRHEIRLHAVKRSIIFFAFATLALALMSIIQAPEKFLNYIFTWHLLHLFAFSTLYLLLIWEISRWFERKNRVSLNHQQIISILLLISLISIIALFIFFHDYTVMIQESNSREFPVSLEILSILKNISFDVSSCGLIPWLSFPLAGGFTASFLNLNRDSQNHVMQKSKLLLLANFLLLIIGFLYLENERFISAGLGYASSFSHVFISIGLNGCIFILLVLILDIHQIIPHKTSYNLLYPIIIVSKISLTVYYVHPVVGVIDPSLIPSESVLLVFVSLYSLFFVLLAHFWQKWDFKFSFEWIVRNYS